MSNKTVPEERAPRLEPGPFSRPIEVHKVPDGGLDMAIEADEAERTAIAADIGLAGLGKLEARFRIDRRAGGRVTVEGELEADITQICVVSLEPFDSIITREMDLTFAPQAQPVELPAAMTRSRRREPAVREAPPRPVVVPGNDDQEDPADPIIDGRIDLGAVALEFLTLSLDLYPRKPGVHFTDVSVGDKDEADESPFAALRRLKDPS